MFMCVCVFGQQNSVLWGLVCSLAGPLHDLVKRAGDKAAAEYASLELQLRSMEEKVAFATNQADAARRDSQQWKKQYEVSMSDYQKLSENSATQYANIQKKVTTLEERHTTSVTKYESAKKEGTEWQTKYEKLVAQHRSDEERFKSDFGALQVNSLHSLCSKKKNC